MNTAQYLLNGAPDDATVLVEGDRHHTYQDLRSAISAVSWRLDELGLPPGSPVALSAPNGLFWTAGYLAILARGMVVVPLSPTLGAVKLADSIAWIGARACLFGPAQHKALKGLLPVGLPVLAEDSQQEWRAGARHTTTRVVDLDAKCDAVYEFTSGSTAEPRVVRLTHRNLQANTESILAYLGLTSADRMLVVLPFSYVFGASLLHTHLRSGAAMVLQSNFVYPESVVERMISEQCTGFAGVPSTFHLLLRNSSFRHRPVSTLRQIQQAGGKLSPVLIRELVSAQPQAEVFVMYGQTEATARLSYLPPSEVLRKIGSIGRGIPGVNLRVVDPAGLPVAPGEVGEIVARGDNISPGYLSDPEATLQKVPNGELHTGDLATVDSDGYVYIVDRTEDFIKSWGYRVASLEVEAVAMELTELVAAAAVGVPDDAAGERVELVVVTKSGSILDSAAVLDHCRTRLDKHMVPQSVRVIDRLPLNANGKVNKRELRSWCAERASPTATESRDA